MDRNLIFRQLIPHPRWPSLGWSALLFVIFVIGGTAYIVNRFQMALPSLQFVMLPALGLAGGWLRC